MPRARGRVRRVAPRHDRVRRPGRVRPAAVAADATICARSRPGSAQYTHLLDPDDAHVVDDIIVWWVDDERFFVMPNASNTERILARVRRRPRARRRRGRVRRRHVDARGARGAGSRGADAARRRCGPTRPTVPRFAVRPVGELVVAGTGYTGEDGVEIHVPAGRRAGVVGRSWSTPGSTPAGPRRPRHAAARSRACRCTATSSGPGITPLQAGLGLGGRLGQGRLPRAGPRSRPSASAGSHRRLRGLTIEGRRPAREGARVLARRRRRRRRSRAATSRRRSGTRIALAFLAPDVEPGADGRGRRARSAARRRRS